MMKPPVTIVVMPVMIVMPMAGLDEVGLPPLPIAQAVLGLPVKPSPVGRIVARPVPFVWFAVSSREDVTIIRFALMKNVSLP